MPLLSQTGAGDAGWQPPSPAPPDLAGATVVLRGGAGEDARRQSARDLAHWPEGTPVLAAALLAEASPRVREAIANALARQASPAAAMALSTALGSEDAGLRAVTIAALRAMGAAALPGLVGLLDAGDADLRILSVGLLDGVPAAQARPLLHRVLAQDPEVNVGLAAVEAMAQVGDAEDMAPLRAFAARFPGQPFVHFAVDLACRHLVRDMEA